MKRKKIREDWFDLDYNRKNRPALRELVYYLHPLIKPIDWSDLIELLKEALDEAATIRQNRLFTKRKFWPWTTKMPCVDVIISHKPYPCPLIIAQQLDTLKRHNEALEKLLEEKEQLPKRSKR